MRHKEHGDLIKRSLFYERAEYEELSRKAKLLKTTASNIIRQLIREYNEKPFLSENQYDTINISKSGNILEKDSEDE